MDNDLNKEAVVFDAVESLNKLAEIDCKWLYTTSGFRLLGIITSDKNLDDEDTGLKPHLTESPVE